MNEWFIVKWQEGAVQQTKEETSLTEEEEEEEEEEQLSLLTDEDIDVVDVVTTEITEKEKPVSKISFSVESIIGRH